jgi:hypothetical protein
MDAQQRYDRIDWWRMKAIGLAMDIRRKKRDV